jgi:hypothetical protein
MNTSAVQGVLVDLDETLYSRENAFWGWIASEAQAAGAGEQLDRERIAELDQRGRGDKRALLEHLAAVFGWRESRDRSATRPRHGAFGNCSTRTQARSSPRAATSTRAKKTIRPHLHCGLLAPVGVEAQRLPKGGRGILPRLAVSELSDVHDAFSS